MTSEYFINFDPPLKEEDGILYHPDSKELIKRMHKETRRLLFVELERLKKILT